MHSLTEHLFRIHRYEKDDFRWYALRKLIRRFIRGNVIFGCGTGHLTLELLQEGYEVTAIDNSKKLVDFLTEIIRTTNYKCEVKLVDVVDSDNFRKLGKERFDTVL